MFLLQYFCSCLVVIDCSVHSMQIYDAKLKLSFATSIHKQSQKNGETCLELVSCKKCINEISQREFFCYLVQKPSFIWSFLWNRDKFFWLNIHRELKKSDYKSSCKQRRNLPYYHKAVVGYSHSQQLYTWCGRVCHQRYTKASEIPSGMAGSKLSSYRDQWLDLSQRLLLGEQPWDLLEEPTHIIINDTQKDLI